ncbi:PadR family transcriptional regulator [Monashia sp. NPDC004114]
MRAERLKGHLDGMLLAALEAGPRHGYAIRDSLRDSTDGEVDLPTGTIYPALHRLESAGLVVGDWSVVGGRRRRTYRLTAAGRRALHAERRDWHRLSTAITVALGPQS